MTPQEEQDYKRLKYLESKLTADPKIKGKFGRVLKEADPAIAVPWLDQEEEIQRAVDERLKKHEEEVALLRRQLVEREATEANERAVNKLKRAPFNLDDGEIEEVKKIVTEKQQQGELISMETAARYYMAMHSQVPARNSVAMPFSTRNARPKDDFRKLLRDPKSPLFTDTQNHCRQAFDEAWDEGLQIINNQ